MNVLQTLNTKPVEQGYIYVTPDELSEYIEASKESFRNLYPEEEVERRCLEMKSGHRPVTFRNWQLKVREQ